MLFPYDYLIVPGAAVALCYMYFQRARADAPTLAKGSVPPPPSFLKRKSDADEGEDDEDLHPMTIFFGSQTGTAEDFAKRLSLEAKSYHFKGKVIDIEEYDPEELVDEAIAFFVVATYGEGEPTDNARDFHTWLMSEEREPGCLSGLKYIVFGLGNRTYEHYNLMGRQLDERLEELGGTRLYDRGEGDDDGSLEEDFMAWKDQMWPGICEQLGISSEGGGKISRAFKMQVHDPDDLPEFSRERSESHAMRLAVDAKVLVNRELHSESSDRSCRHIEIDCTQHDLKYEAGDHLAVFPWNEEALVEAYAKRLGVDLDMQFSMIALDPDSDKSHFPSPCTVRDAFTKYLDISGMINKNTIRAMAEYAEDSAEKDRLMLLAGSSEESRTEYGKYAKQGQRNALEVLEDFPSVKMPLDHFLEVMPTLQCRYYSISSSPKANPNAIHITAVLVEFKTPTNRYKYGVCTRWLSQIDPKKQQTIKCYVRKSTFRLPEEPKRPVVMVGPGTGLAPFRGFLQDRDADLKQMGKGKLGETVLFFGCRDRTKDFIYESELLDYAKRGVLFDLQLAFSRESAKKVYVQHKMAEKKKELFDLLYTKKGYLYICGEGSKMAKDVQQCLHDLLLDGGLSEDQVKKAIDTMKADNRLQLDVWS